MSELDTYYEDVMSNIARLAIANESFSEEVFFDNRMKILIEDGHSTEYEDKGDDNNKDIRGGYHHCYVRQKGHRVDGYEYLIDRSTLVLYVCHFVQSPEIETLTKSEISQFISNTRRFYEKSLRADTIKGFEETSDSYKVASFINKIQNHKKNKIEHIGVRIITNCLLSKRIKDSNLEEHDYFDNKETTLDIWDIKRFFDNEVSSGESEIIEIDLLSEFGKGIPALPVNLESSSYKSFLCIIPGEYLAKLYTKYGSRILEANVRSFLQFKGTVNKGMRDTLKEKPHMFFAYNNGITATAEEFEINDKNEIVFLKNLQIVNGGQTTAALTITNSKNSEVSLHNVFVQAKLSIVDTQTSEEIVPDIARYANTQNKVSNSDFFSNHPFHRKMERKSIQITAPITTGQIRGTKWFYERSRGTYESAKRKTGTATRVEEIAFMLEYPVHQKMDKIGVAKTSVIFDGDPHIAVRGQEAMFKHFAEKIQPRWEKGSHNFNDSFFKEVVAKQIMFRDGRILVMKHISGNKIQPILAYTLFMINALSTTPLSSGIDFKKIWNKQCLDDLLASEFEKSVLFVEKYYNDAIEGTEKTVLSLSKNAKFFASFKAKVESESMRNFLSADYRRAIALGL